MEKAQILAEAAYSYGMLNAIHSEYCDLQMAKKITNDVADKLRGIITIENNENNDIDFPHVVNALQYAFKNLNTLYQIRSLVKLAQDSLQIIIDRAKGLTHEPR